MFWWLMRDFIMRNKLLFAACALFGGIVAHDIFAPNIPSHNGLIYYPALFLPAVWFNRRFAITRATHLSLPVSRRQLERFRWVSEVVYIPLLATLFSLGWGCVLADSFDVPTLIPRLVTYFFISVLICGCTTQSQLASPMAGSNQSQQDFGRMFTPKGALSFGIMALALVLAFRPVFHWSQMGWVDTMAIGAALVVNIALFCYPEALYDGRRHVTSQIRKQKPAALEKQRTSRTLDLLIPWGLLLVNMLLFASYIAVFSLVVRKMGPWGQTAGASTSFLRVAIVMVCLSSPMQWAFSSREFRALPVSRNRLVLMMLGFPALTYSVAAVAALALGVVLGGAPSYAILAYGTAALGPILLMWVLTAAFGQVATMIVAVTVVPVAVIFGVSHEPAALLLWVVWILCMALIPGTYALLRLFVDRSSTFYKPKRLGRALTR